MGNSMSLLSTREGLSATEKAELAGRELAGAMNSSFQTVQPEIEQELINQTQKVVPQFMNSLEDKLTVTPDAPGNLPYPEQIPMPNFPRTQHKVNSAIRGAVDYANLNTTLYNTAGSAFSEVYPTIQSDLTAMSERIIPKLDAELEKNLQNTQTFGSAPVPTPTPMPPPIPVPQGMPPMQPPMPQGMPPMPPMPPMPQGMSPMPLGDGSTSSMSTLEDGTSVIYNIYNKPKNQMQSGMPPMMQQQGMPPMMQQQGMPPMMPPMMQHGCGQCGMPQQSCGCKKKKCKNNKDKTEGREEFMQDLVKKEIKKNEEANKNKEKNKQSYDPADALFNKNDMTGSDYAAPSEPTGMLNSFAPFMK